MPPIRQPSRYQLLFHPDPPAETGMPVSAGGDVRGGGLMMTGLSGSAFAGMSATGAAAPAAGAPVRLLAMSGRKNASI